MPTHRSVSQAATDTGVNPNWICCQLGAREHFAIPRALLRADALQHLYTDLWIPPDSPWFRLAGRRAQDRFHPDLVAAPTTGFNARSLCFELLQRRRRSGWNLILARNAWFQSRVLHACRAHLHREAVVFSYSYTARRLFEAAKQVGCKTVLGQIDPGPGEERLVGAANADCASLAGTWEPAPPSYWRDWAAECALADAIVVNSQWSSDALQAEGISAAKIHIVPLVYQPPVEATGFQSSYPAAFSPSRPLRVLFLGQVNTRKGLGPILDALPLLNGLPIRIQFVGPIQIPLPDSIRNHPQLEWVGSVPRGTVTSYYRESDVFLFPTLSDGFGITQLEAQAWRLPIIASARCGKVVEHGRTGWVLDPVTPEAIAICLRNCLQDPGQLARFSASIPPPQDSITSLATSLLACVS